MNPLMSEMANKARHDELLREAKRIRAAQAAERATAERDAGQNALAAGRPTTLTRALALLTAIITPW